MVSALFSPLMRNLLAFTALSPLTVVPLEYLILVWKVWVWCVSLQISRPDLHTPKSWRKRPLQWQVCWLLLATCRQRPLPDALLPQGRFSSSCSHFSSAKAAPLPQNTHTHTRTNTHKHSPIPSRDEPQCHPVVLWDPGWTLPTTQRGDLCYQCLPSNWKLTRGAFFSTHFLLMRRRDSPASYYLK